MLRSIFQESHSVILILSGKDNHRLISSPSTRNDDWIVRFQKIIIPSVSFEFNIQESKVILSEIDSGQDSRIFVVKF